jgi:hypothetical protein
MNHPNNLMQHLRYCLTFLMFSSLCLNLTAQTIRFEEQKIGIRNFKVLQNQHKDGLSGMFVSFQATIPYGKDHILPNDSGEVFTNYNFFISVYSDGKLLYQPEMKPADCYNYQSSCKYSSQVAEESGSSRNHNLFLAYNKLLLSQGHHKIDIILAACSWNREFILDSLFVYHGDCEMPLLWTNTVEVSNMKIRYSEDWDVAGRSIPFWGFFYSSTSDAGRGYPDVKWKLLAGNDVIYESETWNDGFYGYNGSSVFYTCANDPLHLSVYDVDADFDDYMGSMNLPQSSAGTAVRISGKKCRFGEVEEMNLTYIKERLPMVSRNEIAILSDTNEDGISGAAVVFKYSLENIKEGDHYVVRAFDERPGLKTTLNVNLMDAVTKKTLSEVPVTPEKRSGTVTVFIPNCEISSDLINFVICNTDGSMELARSHNITPLEQRESNDIAFNKAQVSGEHNGSVEGVRIRFAQVDAAAYLAKYGNNVRLRAEMKQVSESENVLSFLFDSCFVSSRELFIPWYRLSEYAEGSNLLSFDLERTVYLLSNSPMGCRIGSNKEKIAVTIPHLNKAGLSNAGFKLSRKSSGAYDLYLSHGSDTVRIASCVARKKKMKTDYIGKYFTYHPDDELSFFLRGTAPGDQPILLAEIKGRNIGDLKNTGNGKQGGLIRTFFLEFDIIK